ncbi:cytochrome b5 [Neoconidiobolus thromboides FSU 785]|nr:cytochrome b5 [Neoconidiobolus thromboides FSU 785]
MNSSIKLLYNQLLQNQTNWLLTAILLVILYNLWTAESKDQDLPVPSYPKAILFKDYTPTELCYYDGQNNKPIYMGVKNNIYDVTNGRNFYGPGGPYENFAGRDASRGLAKNSFDVEVLTDLKDPIDLLENLTKDEWDSLNDWESHFANKYTLVGKLVNP